jgi:cysteinyl-tRNA synthetase
VGFDTILDASGSPPSAASAPPLEPTQPGTAGERAAPSLRAVTDELVTRFDAALADRDVDRCVEAILALDRARLDWAADTNLSDDAEHAGAALRAMVVRLGELATVGARDPQEVLGPFVEALLSMRARARAAKDFTASDEIRDRLTGAGVEVRDTPDGVEWSLR